MKAAQAHHTFGQWLKNSAGLPLLAVLIVAAASFSVAFTWGMPQAVSPETTSTWQVDTIAPVRPLTEAYHRFNREGTDPVVYPLWHFVILDVVYAPYIAHQYFTGALTDPHSDYPYGADHPREFFTSLTLIARGLSLVMALGIVIAVFEITRNLFSREAALWSALLTALIAPLSYYAKTSNLDVPYLFWMSLAVWQIVLIAEHGRLRNFLAFAAFAAFAVASKDQAYGYFVFTPLLLIYLHSLRTNYTASAAALLRSSFSKPIVLTAVLGVLSYAVANNLLFGGFDGFVRHLDFVRAFYAEQLGDTGQPLLDTQLRLFMSSIEITLQLAGPITLLLAATGFFLAVAERRYFAVCLLLLLPASYYLFVLATAGVALPRYLLGTTILMTPFAGHALAQALSVSRLAGYAVPI